MRGGRGGRGKGGRGRGQEARSTDIASRGSIEAVEEVTKYTEQQNDIPNQIESSKHMESTILNERQPTSEAVIEEAEDLNEIDLEISKPKMQFGEQSIHEVNKLEVRDDIKQLRMKLN